MGGFILLLTPSLLEEVWRCRGADFWALDLVQDENSLASYFPSLVNVCPWIGLGRSCGITEHPQTPHLQHP